jgi:hypothetical protein
MSQAALLPVHAVSLGAGLVYFPRITCQVQANQLMQRHLHQMAQAASAEDLQYEASN